MKDYRILNKLFYLGSGLVILFVITVFLLPQINRQWDKYQKLKVKYQLAKVIHDNKIIEIKDLKKEAAQLNLLVNYEADYISLLILEAGTLNDSIIYMLDHIANGLNLADSLELLQGRISQNEREVDSLNLLFESNTSDLLSLIKSYTKSERKLTEDKIELEGFKTKLSGSSIFLFLKVILSCLILFTGIYLLFAGILMRQKTA